MCFEVQAKAEQAKSDAVAAGAQEVRTKEVFENQRHKLGWKKYICIHLETLWRVYSSLSVLPSLLLVNATWGSLFGGRADCSQSDFFLLLLAACRFCASRPPALL